MTLPRTGSDFFEHTLLLYFNISTHAPRTGSDLIALTPDSERCISTHAPRTGSDGEYYNIFWKYNISTHAPRTGSDTITICGWEFTGDFNPRSPHGERRVFALRYCTARKHFNPRSPHGERRYIISQMLYNWDFNPHSPHGERRTAPRICTSASRNFNPRSPHGERRRWCPVCCRKSFSISTHAPRTGSDLRHRVDVGNQVLISTHAPRTGSDRTHPAGQPDRSDFNPRSPHGERRQRFQIKPGNPAISTHAPRTGSDRDRDWLANFARQFQPTLPARGATVRTYFRYCACIFQPTLPARGATALGLEDGGAKGISTHAPRTGSDAA